MIVLKVAIVLLWLFGDGILSGNVSEATEVAKEAVQKEEVKGEPGPFSCRDRDMDMIEAVRRKESELKRREEALAERERLLKEIRDDIAKKGRSLRARLQKIKELKEQIERYNGTKVTHLVKIYENMAPKDAAERLSRLDDATAVLILGHMKEKKAGKILGFVDVTKSVKLSRMLAERIAPGLVSAR